MDKKEALKLVQKNGYELENLPEEFKKDKEVVLAAVKPEDAWLVLLAFRLPLVKAMDAKSELDAGLLGKLFENGFMGVEVEERFGGSGASFTTMCTVIEELAKVDPAVSTCVDVHSTVVNNTIAFWGSEAMKEKYLPRLATDTVGSFCLSEPGSGSDAFALGTRAVANGDGSR